MKLLRAIQEGEVDPVGGKKPVKVDVRIISATNRNLIADVTNGRFREDLYLSPARVPDHGAAAARARAKTSPSWCGTSSCGSPPKRESASARSRPTRWRCSTRIRWPGNVRQLENAIFRAVVLADGDEIGAPSSRSSPLSVGADGRARDRARAGRGAAAGCAPPRRMILDEPPPPCAAGERRRARAHRRRRAMSAPLEEIETEMIRFAIAHYRGQMSEVARRLRIGRSTLYRKLDEIGLGDRRAPRRVGENVASG